MLLAFDVRVEMMDPLKLDAAELAVVRSFARVDTKLKIKILNSIFNNKKT
jgi:hypothetical protein